MPDLSATIDLQRRPWRRLAMLACLACSLATQAATATASSRHDHERAREALQSGQILPLPTVLQKLEHEHPGRVLEVELEQEQGRWIYEVKSLQADGHLVKFKLDAATGAVLKHKAR